MTALSRIFLRKVMLGIGLLYPKNLKFVLVELELTKKWLVSNFTANEQILIILKPLLV